MSYGLDPKDLNFIRAKIVNQRDYLLNTPYITEHGEVKNLLDISFASNHSSRYYAQLLNKIDTIDSYNLALNHVPIFLTVTLDAPFHEMLQGKFDKFKKKYKIVELYSIKNKKRVSKLLELSTSRFINNLVPNNDRYGYLINKIQDRVKLTPKDLYKILSFQLKGFQMSYIFKKIRKEGNEVSYLRVTEPMKSGVPHFHLLLYTKEKYIKGLYDSFHKYFSAPQNKKRLSYRNNKRICTKPLEDGTRETQGFQWDIDSPQSYILKYILKSFRNVEKDEEIDYLQAWYIKNRIPKIITTHTLVPQWIYKKLQIIERDWFYYSDLRRNHFYQSDPLNDKFELHDHDFDREIIYDNGLLRLYKNGRLIISYGEKKNFIIKIRRKLLYYSKTKPPSFSVLSQYKIV